MKLLFFDVDGTIVTEDGSDYIPRSAIDAIRKARENGHKAFINSGRCFSCIKDIHREIGFDGYVCGCGTEIIIDGKSVMHKELSHDFCVSLAEKFINKDIPSTFEGSKYVVRYRNNEVTYLNDGRPADIYDEHFVFDKFTFRYADVDEELLRFVDEHFDIVHHPKTCENAPKGFSKASGMEYVAKYYGLTLDDCIAFGDSANDLQMIQAAGYSVTMGKNEIVDKYADYITKDVREDGIYLAMKHLELI